MQVRVAGRGAGARMRRLHVWASGAAVVAVVAGGLTALPAAGAGKAAAARHAVKVDFGPRGAAHVRGYLADDGQAFSRARGYGWIKVGNGKAVSLVGTG